MKQGWFPVGPSAILAFVLVTGCQGERISALEQENAELVQERAHLTQEMRERERRIVETFTALTDINEDLAAVDEQIVALQPKEDGEAARLAAVTEATHRHIDNLRQALEAKQQRLEELEHQNEKAGVRIAELTRRIRDLSRTLEEKQAFIITLQTRLTEMDGLLAAQGATIATQKLELGRRENEIAAQRRRIERLEESATRVWYVVGSEDELAQNAVVREDGGFLFGWGAVYVLNHPIDEGRFVRATVKTERIEVPGGVSSLVPPRSEASYRIEDSPEGRSTIVIVDAEKFWSFRHLAVIAR